MDGLGWTRLLELGAGLGQLLDEGAAAPQPAAHCAHWYRSAGPQRLTAWHSPLPAVVGPGRAIAIGGLRGGQGNRRAVESDHLRAAGIAWGAQGGELMDGLGSWGGG